MRLVKDPPSSTKDWGVMELMLALRSFNCSSPERRLRGPWKYVLQREGRFQPADLQAAGRMKKRRCGVVDFERIAATVEQK